MSKLLELLEKLVLAIFCPGNEAETTPDAPAYRRRAGRAGRSTQKAGSKGQAAGDSGGTAKRKRNAQAMLA